MSHSINDTKVCLMRNYPVNAILCQTVLLSNSCTNIRHIGYSILKHSTSFLINVMHVVVYSKVRWRANRTTRFHVQERQTFTIGSQNSIHNTYVFRCRFKHEGSSTVTKDRTSSAVCIINHRRHLVSSHNDNLLISS